MPLSKVTTDHEEIRRWAESRGGTPTCVKRTGSSNDPGVLRINFPGYTGDNSLAEIQWEEFFKKFDENGLAFVYQDRTAAGEKSNFNKIVKRETAEAKMPGAKSSSGGKVAKAASTSRKKTSSKKGSSVRSRKR